MPANPVATIAVEVIFGCSALFLVLMCVCAEVRAARKRRLQRLGRLMARRATDDPNVREAQSWALWEEQMRAREGA